LGKPPEMETIMAGLAQAQYQPSPVRRVENRLNLMAVNVNWASNFVDRVIPTAIAQVYAYFRPNLLRATALGSAKSNGAQAVKQVARDYQNGTPFLLSMSICLKFLFDRVDHEIYL